ncbi:type VI secretion system baseplate subunit TssE [Alteromonas sp. ASW11-130]|uniref:type VI secretion system baseplate subunit TssE n=1 Tax=Alteromonas sp. ASW11-130 TaxID=3015775 RepID=UPI0022420E4F|nr:type VI secretion system baseplate subunit TssE [Alteromonas sp. ASW11-130]MCW8092784.1 type VI secretion system baseplate subunit TssE [Alteromonas sp. ASW11-130]
MKHTINENYLMERVRLGAEGRTVSNVFDRHAYRQTLLQHLQIIFNTRQGNAASNPDFGLPDFNDLDMKYGFTTAVREIIRSIKLNIEHFQPGLKRVRVNYIEDERNPLELKFEIVGQVYLNGRNERIKFQTKKSSLGIVEVM